MSNHVKAEDWLISFLCSNPADNNSAWCHGLAHQVYDNILKVGMTPYVCKNASK